MTISFSSITSSNTYDIRSLLSDSRPNVIKKKIVEIDLTD